jgi:hypothetical protein
MHYHLKPFISLRRFKVAANQLELRVGCGKVMVSAGVSGLQAGLTAGVSDIEVMQLR